ncbi:hypothetical protein [Silvimonas amylolytica]|uniref:Uncharacterized protein n=1 Tax=Silvimonas amylolytica TaxID=449663 RepID=A0ABQ2PNM4_9NEIS|nr:hypothetical protein [Silvimonas amylolytica]GGP26564.1 hypothetical protein GCM10010971_23830 [Silvimonas amylolytica]
MEEELSADRNAFQQLAPLQAALRHAGLPPLWARSDLAVELLAEGGSLTHMVSRLATVFGGNSVEGAVYRLSAHDTALRRMVALLHKQHAGQLSGDESRELEECRRMVNDEMSSGG